MEILCHQMSWSAWWGGSWGGWRCWSDSQGAQSGPGNVGEATQGVVEVESNTTEEVEPVGEGRKGDTEKGNGP